MADQGFRGGTSLRMALIALLSLASPLLFSAGETQAQSQLPGYLQAADAFMGLSLDQRVKLQILLTAAGYWPAVPDADFSGRLFNAVLRFEVDGPDGSPDGDRWPLPQRLEV